jgi:hypothetical protein
MAVRVRLRIDAPGGRQLVTAAVLNGGFETEHPHLLVPARCAEALLGEFRSGAPREPIDTAAGRADVWVVPDLDGRVVTADREGRLVRFRALASELEPELLVSDTGIDALGLRIESFAPGRWRFADEAAARDSEPAHLW